MADKSHEGLKWVMRAGYGARGMIYTIVGGLAFAAAIGSGEAEGTKDALKAVRDHPLGLAALWLIGIGLFGYMAWRVIAGIMDVEDHGTDAKGLIARTGQVATGLIHGAIGVSVLGLAMGSGGGGGGGAEDWTQKVMQMPAGRYLVAAGALILAGAGIYYAYKGISGKYKEHLAANKFTRDADDILMGGLVIYGGLLTLVAFSLFYAALTSDPEEAGGLGQAFASLQQMQFGWALLATAGLGLLAFALYNFVEAAYRVVPKVTGTDVKTLASV